MPMRRILPAVNVPRALVLTMVTVALVATSCTRRTGESSVSTNIVGVGATLIVENQRMVDYTIYLSRAGGQRVGLAHPGSTRFFLRADLLPHTGQLTVIGRAVGDGEIVSASAVVPYGRTARLRIMPHDTYLVVDVLPAPPDSTADSTVVPTPDPSPPGGPPRR